MTDYSRIYIDGSWVESSGTHTLDVFDSTNGQIMAHIPAGSADDVDRAARAARSAFPGWASTPVETRGDLLRATADRLVARAETLKDLFTRQAGMPTWLAASSVETTHWTFMNAAAVAEEFTFEEALDTTLVVRDPIGVVGCITPWNYPLNQIASKVAYALAAGCTVVLKPSEIAPLDAFVLAEIIDGLDFPNGVFNLVMGTGPIVGEAIAAHPEIDMVSFTGSTRAGRRVTQIAAETVKRVHVELGGKSANILLDDLDDVTFEAAVRKGILSCFVNSGQTCSAHTRMLVPRRRVADAERIAQDEVETRYQPGDPFTEDVMLGPLASQLQVDRVTGYVDQAVSDGARVVTGGSATPPGLESGYYVMPTVFSDVDNSMTIAQEEVFGPVLTIIAFDDEADAVRIANDSPYGLHGSVWASTTEHATAVARLINTGQVTLNGGAHNHAAPWGGYKQSGNGREYGREGFQEFLETKAMHL